MAVWALQKHRRLKKVWGVMYQNLRWVCLGAEWVSQLDD